MTSTKVINDSCSTCGSNVEIGAVIDNSDLALTVSFTTLELASKEAQAVSQQFPDTQIAITEGQECQLTMTFSCGAEKMIYLMSKR